MQPLTTVDDTHIRTLLDRGTYVWLDLVAPDESTLAALGRALPIHPLALEDGIDQRQPAHVRRYDDSALIVYYGAQSEPGGVATALTVHLHVGHGFLVTIYGARSSAVDAVRESAANQPTDASGGVAYGVLDAVTDTIAPALDFQHDELERLRSEILVRPDRDVLSQVDGLHGHIDRLQQRLTHQRDVFADIVDVVLGLPGTPADAKVYLQDVEGHLAGAVSILAEQVTAVDRLMDLYYNASSQHAGVVSSRVTLLGALLVPLTLVTGFFGMNFGWMTDQLDTAAGFFVFGVGGTLVSLAVTLIILRATSRS